MNRTLEQHRAKYALDQVQSWIKEGKTKQGADKYCTLVRRMPSMVQGNGLGQALAFLLADSKGEANAPSKHLYDNMYDWLIKKENKKDRPCAVYSKSADLISALMSGDRMQYRRSQQEILALLNWMVKFSNAYLPKGEG